MLDGVVLEDHTPIIYSSLRDRWGRVNEDVNAFVSAYNEATRMLGNRSGHNEDDVQAMACRIFSENHKEHKPFNDKHCWLPSNEYPQWQKHMEWNGKPKPKQANFGGEDAPSPMEQSGGSGSKCPCIASENSDAGSRCPMGPNTAKMHQSRGNTSHMSTHSYIKTLARTSSHLTPNIVNILKLRRKDLK